MNIREKISVLLCHFIVIISEFFFPFFLSFFISTTLNSFEMLLLLSYSVIDIKIIFIVQFTVENCWAIIRHDFMMKTKKAKQKKHLFSLIHINFWFRYILFFFEKNVKENCCSCNPCRFYICNWNYCMSNTNSCTLKFSQQIIKDKMHLHVSVLKLKMYVGSFSDCVHTTE